MRQHEVDETRSAGVARQTWTVVGLVAGATCIGIAASWLVSSRNTTVGSSSSYIIPFGGCFAVGAWAVVVREVVRFSGRPRVDRQIVEPSEDLDGSSAFASYAVTRVQVRAALDDNSALGRVLAPIVAELADDRLLRNHGIDRARRPEKAHDLLGDDLWSIVVRSSDMHRLDADDLRRALDRLETL